MEIIIALLCSILWLVAWYYFFYLRYEDVKLIDELRKNYKQLKQDYEILESDIWMIEDENKILRDETKKLLTENEDLQKIVSQLNIYVYRLKIGSQKAKELAKILWIYNQDLEDKIKNILGENFSDEFAESDDIQSDKKIF